ncbi:MAG: AAA family ATPase [candidate division WS1 bacterium]|nr:AAA family ATPase [candidate division WS1 bacterium]
MDGKRFITKLRLRNLLSFGPDAEEFELEPLNVLIGPNASGKSNVIEAISLLQAAPDDIQEPIRRGVGIREWLWKGGEKKPEAEIDATVDWGRTPALRHLLRIAGPSDTFELVRESITASPESGGDVREHYQYHRGQARLWSSAPGVAQRSLAADQLRPNHSILAQIRDPANYAQLAYLGEKFRRIHIFRDWDTSRDGDLRRAQFPDLQSDFLTEDANNLALVINNLQNRCVGLQERIESELSRFYPRTKKVGVRVEGGTVQLLLHEDGLRDPIPATRMSDGTLRYLCLLSILLHPEPPPLVCIEEPEIGLHPDIIVRLAHLMEEASERMQLIVTTHSDALVSALSGIPEAVAICERDEGGSTKIRRLDREDLEEWLEGYTLGDLWIRGELGGNP